MSKRQLRLGAFIRVTGHRPELQRRGLLRTAYEGTKLRENLDLERPVNQFTVRQQRVA